MDELSRSQRSVQNVWQLFHSLDSRLETNKCTRRQERGRQQQGALGVPTKKGGASKYCFVKDRPTRLKSSLSLNEDDYHTERLGGTRNYSMSVVGQNKMPGRWQAEGPKRKRSHPQRVPRFPPERRPTIVFRDRAPPLLSSISWFGVQVDTVHIRSQNRNGLYFTRHPCREKGATGFLSANNAMPWLETRYNINPETPHVLYLVTPTLPAR